MKTAEQRFWDKVEIIPFHQCWEWIGSKDKNGYGLIKRNGRSVRAHRASYEINIGEIPSGMVIMHSCDNPGCVNPEHLSVGTPLQNSLDCKVKGRTHSLNNRKFCLKGGHLLTPDTISINPKTGQNLCRTCANIRSRIECRKYRVKKKAERDALLIVSALPLTIL